MKVDLTGLDKAIGCVLIQRTMERNQLLVSLVKSKLSWQQQGLREDKSEKVTKPEELVRLFDTIIQVSDTGNFMNFYFRNMCKMSQP